MLLAQAQTATTDFRLQPLQAYYEDTFNLVYQIIDALNMPYAETTHNRLTQLVSELNQITSQRHQKVITILQAENMDFMLNADGSLSYEYVK